MADSPPFNPLAPGFDFLQSLVKNAGAAMPGMGQWVAPTLNPEEIEKRIGELKTVQFWLEQNARLLGATIQALEVQRMTLSTLKTMNVQFGDLREAMTIRVPAAADAPAAFSASPPEPAPAPPEAGASAAADAVSASDAKPAGVVDPMQWWGALTKQFTELASAAIQPAATDAATGATAMPTAAVATKKTTAGTAPPKTAATTPRRTAKTSTARKRAAPSRP